MNCEHIESHLMTKVKICAKREPECGDMLATRYVASPLAILEMKTPNKVPHEASGHG